MNQASIKKQFLWAAYLYERILQSSTPKIFKILFNARSYVRNRKIRCDITLEEKFLFKFSDEYGSWVTFESKMGSLSYARGLRNRGRELSEAYLLQLIEFKDNDLIIDCGANVGDFYISLILENRRFEYIGFEPAPKEYRALTSNIKNFLPCKITPRVFNLALSDFDDDKADFYVSSGGADSSLIEPAQFTHKCKVRKRRYDSLDQELTQGQGVIRLLKLEAEGAEPEVIRGFSGVLNRVEWVSADLGFERGKEKKSTLVDVNAFLSEYNFRIVAINYARMIVLFRKMP
jgi:FkbM family methyltransferase